MDFSVHECLCTIFGFDGPLGSIVYGEFLKNNCNSTGILSHAGTCSMCVPSASRADLQLMSEILQNFSQHCTHYLLHLFSCVNSIF